MARKRKQSGFEEVLRLNWQGVLAFAGLAAAVAIAIPYFAGTNPVLKPVASMFAQLAWLISFGLIVLALAKLLYARLRSRKPSAAASARVYAPKADGMEERHESYGLSKLMDEPVHGVLSLPQQSKPPRWSVDLLRELEWKRFELVCNAYYEKRGFRVECIARGPDGGIDAKLYFGQIKEPVGLIQCKAWNEKMVGVKPVRELLGVMVHNKVAKGIFHATGRFSDEATAFAAANKIQLIGGEDFIKAIASLDEATQQQLLAIAVDGDYRTPTCPSCGIKLVRRDSKRGGFWGCTNYPTCKVLINASF